MRPIEYKVRDGHEVSYRISSVYAAVWAVCVVKRYWMLATQAAELNRLSIAHIARLVSDTHPGHTDPITVTLQYGVRGTLRHHDASGDANDHPPKKYEPPRHSANRERIRDRDIPRTWTPSA